MKKAAARLGRKIDRRGPGPKIWIAINKDAATTAVIQDSRGCP